MNRRSSIALVAIAMAASWCRAEPVTIELQPQSKVQFAIVTVGNVARLSGGDAALRDQIARLDLADLKPREQNLSISRRVVEYRLKLAGIDAASVLITGAERSSITSDRRVITAEEVVAAARLEVEHWLTVPREGVTIELAKPVAVRLPEVPAGEAVAITAFPHVKPVGLGRVQMHVVISTAEEKLLSLGVDLDVKPLNRTAEAGAQGAAPRMMPMNNFEPAPTGPATRTALVNSPDPASQVIPASATTMSSPEASTVIRPRQRVTMLVRSGGLSVTAVGEAQQEGRLGQTILVQNVDSRKMVSARVSGPGTVEVEIDK